MYFLLLVALQSNDTREMLFFFWLASPAELRNEDLIVHMCAHITVIFIYWYFQATLLVPHITMLCKDPGTSLCVFRGTAPRAVRGCRCQQNHAAEPDAHAQNQRISFFSSSFH